MTRIVRAMAVQTGPAGEDLDENLRSARKIIDGAATSPDLIVLPELFSRPFWCVGHTDQRYMAWSEDLRGPTLEAMREVARDHEAVVVVPFFERGRVRGEYYNSAAVLSPSGELVAGTLPDGRSVPVYRKCAISSYRWDEQVNDEKFYFRQGSGYAVFPTPAGVLGVLICYDRWFPEAWRVLALQGAEIICVVNASQGDVSDIFVPSMRTCAAQNLVFVVATNRVGTEHVGGRTVSYYGSTSLFNPRGEVLGLAAGAEPQAVQAELDLSRIDRDRTRQTMYRDRRPELYGLVSDATGGGA